LRVWRDGTFGSERDTSNSLGIGRWRRGRFLLLQRNGLSAVCVADGLYYVNTFGVWRGTVYEEEV